ncbi:DUF6126 family protein [Streptomyces acidiscabies]|uniref:DUF6126 family protein n=1 Tax=Streptomyces acidiscabies TaxID=42234 RepID=A0AAP6EMA9_9ACTN|nr:DUF6126 family protein [Streptomyces acidiscabies]MBP5942181.1 hypothetical protein [Streptomyces sp. LBUM 1476]MBZ3913695.1 hypothetical protein [Streptomyces acidiscabies]MDX2967190.1 DUF6126 family protein [Streptomyces acidiscabies]MDX3025904.1 DUF6126 family protein [Streptomyces acidiscabies]MDX3796828.1 DUF6126 family protein [Streptomyces acidiscabies]
MKEQVPDRPARWWRKQCAQDRDSRVQRGVALRAFIYIFGTHIIAGWVMLLFYLGGHANK